MIIQASLCLRSTCPTRRGARGQSACPVLPQATKLKKEQENLLKQHWELERLDDERKQMAIVRRKTELGCVGKPGLFQGGGPLRTKGGVACGEQMLIGSAGLKRLDSPLQAHLATSVQCAAQQAHPADPGGAGE